MSRSQNFLEMNNLPPRTKKNNSTKLSTTFSSNRSPTPLDFSRSLSLLPLRLVSPNPPNSSTSLDCGANGRERGAEPPHYAALPGPGRPRTDDPVEESNRYGVAINHVCALRRSCSPLGCPCLHRKQIRRLRGGEGASVHEATDERVAAAAARQGGPRGVLPVPGTQRHRDRHREGHPAEG